MTIQARHNSVFSVAQQFGNNNNTATAVTAATATPARWAKRFGSANLAGLSADGFERTANQTSNIKIRFGRMAAPKRDYSHYAGILPPEDIAFLVELDEAERAFLEEHMTNFYLREAGFAEKQTDFDIIQKNYPVLHSDETASRLKKMVATVQQCGEDSSELDELVSRYQDAGLYTPLYEHINAVQRAADELTRARSTMGINLSDLIGLMGFLEDAEDFINQLEENPNITYYAIRAVASANATLKIEADALTSVGFPVEELQQHVIKPILEIYLSKSDINLDDLAEAESGGYEALGKLFEDQLDPHIGDVADAFITKLRNGQIRADLKETFVAIKEQVPKRVQKAEEAHQQAVENLAAQQRLLAQSEGETNYLNFITAAEELSITQLCALARTLKQAVKDDYFEHSMRIYTRHAPDAGDDKDNEPGDSASWVEWYAKDHILELEGIGPTEMVAREWEAVQSTLAALAPAFFQQMMPVNPRSIEEAQQLLAADPTQKRVLVDGVDRDNKTRFSQCIFINNQLIILILAGTEEPLRQSIMHEAAHGLQYSYVDGEVPLRQSYPTTLSTMEAFAMFFETLYFNPSWLKEKLQIKEGKTAQLIANTSTFNKLKTSIDTALRFEFEKSLSDSEDTRTVAEKVQAHDESRKDFFGENIGSVDWQKIFIPDNVDIGHFMGHILAGQLWAYMQDNFGGDAWYQNKPNAQGQTAGAFLKSLFAQGNLSPAELSAQLGFNDPTDTAPFMRMINAGLAV